MRLYELTKPEGRGAAVSYLISKGYERIGYGLFASIMHKPGTDYVLKMFDQSDKAYLTYLKLIQANKNPFFPVLKSKPIEIKTVSNFYAIKMEILKPSTDGYDSEKIYSYSFALKMEKVDERSKLLIESYRKLYPELSNALDLIFINIVKPKIGKFDLVEDNIMLRGSQLVLTDPVS